MALECLVCYFCKISVNDKVAMEIGNLSDCIFFISYERMGDDGRVISGEAEVRKGEGKAASDDEVETLALFFFIARVQVCAFFSARRRQGNQEEEETKLLFLWKEEEIGSV